MRRRDAKGTVSEAQIILYTNDAPVKAKQEIQAVIQKFEQDHSTREEKVQWLRTRFDMCIYLYKSLQKNFSPERFLALEDAMAVLQQGLNHKDLQFVTKFAAKNQVQQHLEMKNEIHKYIQEKNKSKLIQIPGQQLELIKQQKQRALQQKQSTSGQQASRPEQTPILGKSNPEKQPTTRTKQKSENKQSSSTVRSTFSTQSKKERRNDQNRSSQCCLFM